jgi:hypothetical protein
MQIYNLAVFVIIVILCFITIFYLKKYPITQLKIEPFQQSAAPTNPITVNDLSTQIMKPFEPEFVRYVMVGWFNEIPKNTALELFSLKNYYKDNYPNISSWNIKDVSINRDTGIITLNTSHKYKISLVLNRLIKDVNSDLDLLLVTVDNNNNNSTFLTTTYVDNDCSVTLVLYSYLINIKSIKPMIRSRSDKVKTSSSGIDTSVYLFIERVA